MCLYSKCNLVWITFWGASEHTTWPISFAFWSVNCSCSYCMHCLIKTEVSHWSINVTWCKWKRTWYQCVRGSCGAVDRYTWFLWWNKQVNCNRFNLSTNCCTKSFIPTNPCTLVPTATTSLLVSTVLKNSSTFVNLKFTVMLFSGKRFSNRFWHGTKSQTTNRVHFNRIIMRKKKKSDITIL